MASYQARQRDPLLDQNMQAMLERRGRELIGIVLVGVALLFALMLWSYSPEDPGWMVATDEPAKNLLGRFGAALASTLIIIGGKGTWAIPVILGAWGLRFTLHRGAERALGRIVFAVIAVAMCSVYAASLVPGADWPHSFGLGGLFGDTVLGALIGMVPGGAGFGLKLVSLLMGFGVLAMMLFVTGFDAREVRVILRFLMVGSVICYNAALNLAGSGAKTTARAAQTMQERRRAAGTDPRRVDDTPRPRRAGEPPLDARRDTAPEWGRPTQLRADPRYGATLAEAPHYAPPKEKQGLLSRVPGLMRRTVEPEPELVEQEPLDYGDDFRPDEDRIKARISDVIKSRIRHPNGPVNVSSAQGRREPAVTRPNRPVTLVADTARRVAEPPLFAAAPVVAPAAASAFGRIVPPPPELPEELDGENLFRADLDEDWSPETDEADAADFPPAPMPVPRLGAAERRPVVQHGMKKPVAPSRQAIAESQPKLRFDDPAPAYELPPLSLLSSPEGITRHTLSDEALEENARMLESVLDDYGVKGEIVSVRPGPVVTMYELEPAPGLKASRVIGLADDIARSMSALSARVSTVPGRTVIGIELPNAVREKVVLREILSARDFGDSNMRLPLALGKDIGGEPIVANLAKMPHLLIAGTTGSGKSVAINTMILSLLYKLSPEECRLIMIDPKMLELSVYDGIPHLLSPVVTDPKKAVVALKWVVGEMEERYRKMSKMGVRNIEGYNGRVREALAKGEMFKRTIQTGFDEDTGEPVFETEEFAPVALPYIVVIVDEMADLMMVAGKEIEACIQRLAQMARASGIHLIMATQRPSVDVITGTIKANFPTRISFQVTSKIDSRTILGEQGAEQLLGMGDMLYMAGGAKITRIHGPFVSDEEVEEIVNHLKSFGPPAYMSGVVEGVEDERADDIDMVLGLGVGEGGDDALYDQAVAIVARDRKCSTSYIQRKLGIGYNKAARLVEQMEEQQVVTRANHVGKREILVPEA
ncbi:DNA translocase FtsK [Paragemmobacter straminiformis]|uniref:DNA translocase FtsK n=1 Tax=Paragemmobacter straminiformis TaxID=2045119 RepID=A0A842IAE4_9RHOB|nr:DNA translocase FtsK [Gemmobacter straminiformis]MBC2835958.1 DNA translocase FtsK 4TM domain-containing protein [Gemmobacter straminiformis]